MKEIRRIIQLYDQLKADGTAAALAIVVDVEASSYRRIGARLLVAADGRYVGGISGGCLEGDALRRARAAILAGIPSTHTYDTLDGEDAVIGIGLGCEGRIDVLFIPLDYSDPENEVETLRQLVDIRQPQVFLRQLKADLYGKSNPRMFPTTHLGYLEQLTDSFRGELHDMAQSILQAGRSRRQIVRGEKGYPHAILCEVFHPEIHLILTGTNYDIPPTLMAAKQLGWRTTVVGARRKFTETISSAADQLLDYREVAKLKIDPATAVVLMSHDYDWDCKMVQHFLPLRPPYFGMLGPRKRAQKMHENLQQTNDLNLLDYPNLFSPVGLDIGAETPEEIATSLTSEIIAAFRRRDGRMLRGRVGSIHGEL